MTKKDIPNKPIQHQQQKQPQMAIPIQTFPNRPQVGIPIQTASTQPQMAIPIQIGNQMRPQMAFPIPISTSNRQTSPQMAIPIQQLGNQRPQMAIPIQTQSFKPPQMAIPIQSSPNQMAFQPFGSQAMQTIDIPGVGRILVPSSSMSTNTNSMIQTPYGSFLPLGGTGAQCFSSSGHQFISAPNMSGIQIIPFQNRMATPVNHSSGFPQIIPLSSLMTKQNNVKQQQTPLILLSNQNVSSKKVNYA